MLSRLVNRATPELTPSVKRGQGCWIPDDVQKVFIHAEPDHVQFGFYAGSKLKDPEGLLADRGKHVRHVKVFADSNIQEEAFENLIKQVL